MKVFIEGCYIQLTKGQIAQIEAKKKMIEKLRGDSRSSYLKVFKIFGIKKLPDSETAFEHPDYDWYLELILHGNWYSVWAVGKGIPDSPFPGGKMASDAGTLYGILKTAIEQQ